jgi:predicted metalloprotease with PDZ domain
MRKRLRLAAFQSIAILLFLISASLGETCPRPQGGSFVSYVVAPELAAGSLKLKVELTFKLANRSDVELVLPSEWQGARELYKQVSGIRVLSPATSLRDSDNPARRRLSFERGKPVHVEYVFEPAEPTQPSGIFFGAVLNPGFFVLTGRNFLVYPDIPEHEELPVSVEWEGFPAGWALADSLGVNQTCQQTKSLLALSNGLFVGGDFRLTKRIVAGRPIYVAVRGEWPFRDEDFADLAAKVLSAEREFWNDHNAPHYLVTLMPIDAPSGEYAGTAVENGFLMLMSPGTNLGFDVQFLLAHEMFHAWNPAQLEEVGPEDPVYWFSEGFTDYYARLLLLRSSIITPQEYVNSINRAYSEYMASPARNYGEHLVESQYFDNAAVQRLPYLQGSLLALKWSALIGDHSAKRQTLDDAMRALRRKAQSAEQTLTDRSLGTFLSAFAGPDASLDIQNHIVLGQTLPLPPNALGSCFSLVRKPLYTFESGFDIEALYRDGRIQSVKPGSEAYKAGLRDGQTVIKSGAIDPNDPDHAIEMTVLDSGMPKRIRYLPHGVESEIDQYEMKAASNGQPCPDTFLQ